jgi:hypothetical protein
MQLNFIFEFDKIDKYEIISPLDLKNVWVRDKQTGDVSIDGQENQMMEIGVSQLVCQFDESLAFSSQ